MSNEDRAVVLRRKAHEDEYAMEILLRDASSPDSALGFHAQQSVEKLLKALLIRSRITYPKTHDLEFLIELLEEAGLTLPAETRDSILLTTYSVGYRYDFVPDLEGGPLDRPWAITCVRVTREWVDSLLSKPL